MAVTFVSFLQSPSTLWVVPSRSHSDDAPKGQTVPTSPQPGGQLQGWGTAGQHDSPGLCFPWRDVTETTSPPPLSSAATKSNQPQQKKFFLIL